MPLDNHFTDFEPSKEVKWECLSKECQTMSKLESKVAYKHQAIKKLGGFYLPVNSSSVMSGCFPIFLG